MSLTLQQIVDFADKYPNTETDAYKCDYLDSLQRELHHRFEFPEEIEEIQTVANQALYTLPSYIKPSRIKSVVVTDSDGSNPQIYDKRHYSQELVTYCYYTIETENTVMMRIYPTPITTGELIMINFEDGPNTLSSTDMTTVPRLFKDFHFKIFVNGLKTHLAELRNDVAMRNNFQGGFDEGVKEAAEYLNDHSPRLIIDVYGIGGD